METVLFLAHTEPDGGLSKASLEALTAAKAAATGGRLIVTQRQCVVAKA